MGAARTLLLWDVDLTLVDYSGIGAEWYRTALANAVGVHLAQMPRFAGRTELSITRELLRRHDCDPSAEHVDRVFTELVAAAKAAEPTLAGRGHALPGASAALAEFAGRDDVVQSLVTGNLPELAEYKLRAFDLDRHVDFDVGGYGSLSEHRHDLITEAVARAQDKYRTAFPPSRVVVVGDTPADVAGALRHGAVAVGVATGRSSGAELTDAGAHAVLADLGDTALTVRTLLGEPCP